MKAALLTNLSAPGNDALLAMIGHASDLIVQHGHSTKIDIYEIGCQRKDCSRPAARSLGISPQPPAENVEPLVILLCPRHAAELQRSLEAIEAKVKQKKTELS